MSYMSLYANSEVIENNYDPHSKVGLMIANEAADESGDPLDFLIELEEHLMQEHNMTLMQAVRAGVIRKS